MLTASKLLPPFDLVGAHRHNILEVYAVSHCVVFNGYFISCVSVCQLVLVCPGFDLKLPITSIGTNDLAVEAP